MTFKPALFQMLASIQPITTENVAHMKWKFKKGYKNHFGNWTVNASHPKTRHTASRAMDFKLEIAKPMGSAHLYNKLAANNRSLTSKKFQQFSTNYFCQVPLWRTTCRNDRHKLITKSHFSISSIACQTIMKVTRKMLPTVVFGNIKYFC